MKNTLFAIVSLVSTVPALYLGMKAVVRFDLPFVCGFIPVFICLALAFVFISLAEQEMAHR